MTPKDTIIVPVEATVDLRIALYTQIGVIAEALDALTLRSDREHHPQRYHQPLQNLDRIRRLLDMIGWSQSNRRISVGLDLREHRAALVGGSRPPGSLHRDPVTLIQMTTPRATIWPGAEIVIDICQAIEEHTRFDATARYRHSTIPCVIEFAVPTIHFDGALAAALGYLAAGLSSERTSNGN